MEGYVRLWADEAIFRTWPEGFSGAALEGFSVGTGRMDWEKGT
jgi:hypothetical protein